jgi:hypothetical protein
MTRLAAKDLATHFARLAGGPHRWASVAWRAEYTGRVVRLRDDTVQLPTFILEICPHEPTSFDHLRIILDEAREQGFRTGGLAVDGTLGLVLDDEDDRQTDVLETFGIYLPAMGGRP